MVIASVCLMVCVFLILGIVRWNRRPWPQMGHGDAYFRSAQIQGYGDGYFKSAEVRTTVGS